MGALQLDSITVHPSRNSLKRLDNVRNDVAVRVDGEVDDVPKVVSLCSHSVHHLVAAYLQHIALSVTSEDRKDRVGPVEARHRWTA